MSSKAYTRAQGCQVSVFIEMILFFFLSKKYYDILDIIIAVLFIYREENVAQLLKSMFEKMSSEVSVVNGTQVLLTLLESRRTG